MTVTYLPPMTYGGARPGDALLMEAVTEGPAYARSRAASRWHLVRSAVDRLRHDGEIVRSFHYWCGTFVSGLRAITTDQLPAADPVCGTCYGREAGYDPERPDLLFTPRVGRPTKCPGSRTSWYRETTAWNRGVCLACHEPVKLRAFGGPYNSSWGVQNHRPGPGLVTGCPFHGWRELTLATAPHGDQPVVVCRCRIKEDR